MKIYIYTNNSAFYYKTIVQHLYYGRHSVFSYRPSGLERETELSSCLSTRGPRMALPCWEWILKCRPRWPHAIPRKNVFYTLHRKKYKILLPGCKGNKIYVHTLLPFTYSFLPAICSNGTVVLRITQSPQIKSTLSAILLSNHYQT